MIHMIVQWCCVLDCPADQSEFYRAACKQFGKETANKFTFEQTFPPDPDEEDVVYTLDDIRRTGSDELNRVADIILNGAAPGGRAAV